MFLYQCISCFGMETERTMGGSLYQIWEGLIEFIEFSLRGGVMIFFRRVSNRPVLILLQNH